MHSKFDFHASLAATTQTVDRLRDEISTKAGYEDTRIALSLLEREVVKLGETTVEQSQLETILRSKIDTQRLESNCGSCSKWQLRRNKFTSHTDVDPKHQICPFKT